MAFNLFKLVGGSKLLVLPAVGLVVGGTGVCYGTYRVSRAWTGSALGTDFEEAGTLCQVVSTIAGGGAAGGFLFARHSNYRPLPFRTILERMHADLANAPPASVTRAVSSGGTVIHTSTQLVNPRPIPTSAVPVQTWLHDMRVRTTLFLRAARVPARFYTVNILGTALLAGSVTSVAQRFVCGKTGHSDEVGNLGKIGAAKQQKARAPAPEVTPAAPVPTASTDAPTTAADGQEE